MFIGYIKKFTNNSAIVPRLTIWDSIGGGVNFTNMKKTPPPLVIEKG